MAITCRCAIWEHTCLRSPRLAAALRGPANVKVILGPVGEQSPGLVQAVVPEQVVQLRLRKLQRGSRLRPGTRKAVKARLLPGGLKAITLEVNSNDPMVRNLRLAKGVPSRCHQVQVGQPKSMRRVLEGLVCGGSNE